MESETRVKRNDGRVLINPLDLDVPLGGAVPPSEHVELDDLQPSLSPDCWEDIRMFFRQRHEHHHPHTPHNSGPTTYEISPHRRDSCASDWSSSANQEPPTSPVDANESTSSYSSEVSDTEFVDIWKTFELENEELYSETLPHRESTNTEYEIRKHRDLSNVGI